MARIFFEEWLTTQIWPSFKNKTKWFGNIFNGCIIVVLNVFKIWDDLPLITIFVFGLLISVVLVGSFLNAKYDFSHTSVCVRFRKLHRYLLIDWVCCTLISRVQEVSIKLFMHVYLTDWWCPHSQQPFPLSIKNTFYMRYTIFRVVQYTFLPHCMRDNTVIY